MSSTFPLFNLPSASLSTVLNTVELNELFKISLCSKKSAKLSKSIRNNSKKVDITFVPANSEVSIERAFEMIYLFYAFDISELPEGQHEQLKIGDTIVPITKGEYGSLNTYWEDKFIGITKLLDYVTDFFDSPIHGLLLGGQRYPWDLKKTIDWTMRRQGSIANVYFENNFECNKTEEEELKHFLDTCKITYDLHLDVETSEQFKHTIQFELEHLVLKHAHWLTLDNLFSLNCRYLEIEHHSLTSNDINAFLTHWLNGGNSRLGLLTLQRKEEADIGVIVSGLNAVQRTYNEQQTFKVLNKHGQVGLKIFFSHSYDIRRNDGVMGSIVHYPDSYPDRGLIGFLVWPDWTNQPYS